MKKILFIIAAVVLSSVVLRAESLFIVDEYGSTKVKGEITGDFDQVTAFKAAKRWFNTADMDKDGIGSDSYKEVENESITFSGNFNTQSRWNPFAGDFLEYLTFICELKCAEGVISYELRDLSILYIYAGFGVKEKHTSVAEMVEQIEECQAIIDNPKSSKKEIEEARKKMKDPKESLVSAEGEIQKRINKGIEKTLKKVMK